MKENDVLGNSEGDPSIEPMPVYESPSDRAGTLLPLFSTAKNYDFWMDDEPDSFSRPGSRWADEMPHSANSFSSPKRTLDLISQSPSRHGQHPESSANVVFGRDSESIVGKKPVVGPREPAVSAAGPSEAREVLRAGRSQQQGRMKPKRKPGYCGNCLPHYCQLCDRSFLASYIPLMRLGRLFSPFVSRTRLI
jgi:hypothetical protein